MVGLGYGEEGGKNKVKIAFQKTQKKGMGVCVWGAIVIDYRSHSINFGGTVYVHIFMDEVINDKVVPMFQTRPHLTYIYDNARPNVAIVTTNQLANLEFQCFFGRQNHLT